MDLSINDFIEYKNETSLVAEFGYRFGRDVSKQIMAITNFVTKEITFFIYDHNNKIEETNNLERALEIYNSL